MSGLWGETVVIEESKAQSSAFPRLAGQGYRSVVSFGQQSDIAQAQSDTRNITVGNIIPAIEFIKYFTLLRSRDTYSIVGYGRVSVCACKVHEMLIATSLPEYLMAFSNRLLMMFAKCTGSAVTS